MMTRVRLICFVLLIALFPLCALSQVDWESVFGEAQFAGAEEITFRSVDYGNGVWVAVGWHSGISQGVIFRSEDGRTWTRVDQSGEWGISAPYRPGSLPDVTRVRFINGRFFTVGAQATSSMSEAGDPPFLSSPDGLNWVPHGWNGVELACTVCNLQDITYGDGFYFLSAGAHLYFSSDAHNWTEVETPPDTGWAWKSVAYNNGQFGAVGFNYNLLPQLVIGGLTGPFVRQEGADVLSTRTGAPVKLAADTAIQALNGRWIATSGDNGLIHSDDGETWVNGSMNLSGVDTFRSAAKRVVYGNGVYVALLDRRIRFSEDLLAYGLVKLGVFGTYDNSHDIAVGEEAFVVVGTKGQILYSPFAAAEEFPQLTSANQAVAILDEPFSFQPEANFAIQAAGTSALTHWLSGLPNNLSRNTQTGLISGTPRETGTFRFFLGVSTTDDWAVGAQQVMTLEVREASSGEAPSITSPGLAEGTVFSAFSYTIATNEPANSFSANGLPAGLSFNPTTGAISGVPLVSGVFPVTLSATNANGTGQLTLQLEIAQYLFPGGWVYIFEDPSGENAWGYDPATDAWALILPFWMVYGGDWQRFPPF